MVIETTLLYAGMLGLLLIILSFNVMQNWVRVTGEGYQTDRQMRRAERILSSFVEYVPLGLILLALMEQKGAPALIIHFLGIMLVIARLLHAYGSNLMPAAGLARFLGAQLTFLMLTVTSFACIYFFGLGRAGL